MLEHMPASGGVRRLAGQGHCLRLAFSPTTGLCLCVYLAVPQRGQFIVLQLVATDNNRYSLHRIASLFNTQVRTAAASLSSPAHICCQPPPRSLRPPPPFCSQETLVDFVLTSTDIWSIWVDDSNTNVVKYINFEQWVLEYRGLTGVFANGLSRLKSNLVLHPIIKARPFRML